MKKRTWMWIGLAAGLVCLVVLSCCCFTGMLGSLGSPPPPAAPAAGPQEPQPPPATPSPPTEPVAATAAAGAEPGPCDGLDPIELPPFDREARVELEVLVGDDHRPRLRLRHNLPLGTILMADVEGHNFHGQSRVIADASCVVAGPFGPSGGLPLGAYTASVITPDAAVHPTAVRDALGEHGRNLRGPQVQRSGGERRVEVERRFTVGDAAVARASDASRAATTRDLRRRLRQAVQAGRAMRSLRRSESLESLRRCGDRMRELQGDLRQIRAEAETNGDRQVAAATGPAMMCVSCARDADEWCRNADIPR